ncbi:hypothetical protein K503DRAFT_770249 [Rhizopogon vinicolor AM-OR11-026]|uniref:CBM1 domain-containing protein n=1 Tax=Rhizopogon vinicolor AM-OR11-026 TaxID=1314800 RepID=A0A1B7N1F5_9AGAM|nr:hypothetical protein K503DRAFT_770249 [Rhizopogon vinicolor AM-OR11-026]
MKPVQFVCLILLAAVGTAKPLLPSCTVPSCQLQCWQSYEDAWPTCQGSAYPNTFDQAGCWRCCKCDYN